MRSSPSARPRPARRNWWQRCLDSDDGRLWVALLPAFPVAYAITFPALYLWGQAEERVRAPDSAAAALLFMMVFWLLYSLAYALLTLHRYRRLASARLHEDLRTVSRGSTGRFLGWWRMGSTLSWSAQLAVLALTMVVAVMLIPEARALLALRILGVLAVAASWVLLVLSQTLAYARTNAQVGGDRVRRDTGPVLGRLPLPGHLRLRHARPGGCHPVRPQGPDPDAQPRARQLRLQLHGGGHARDAAAGVTY